jgi:hypothetical protein
VQSVTDLDERHTEIQVTAVEVVGRGTTPSGVPVNVPPTIVEGPESTTIDAGDVVLLTVIAAGAAPLSYQWTENGADLPGEIYQFLETGPIAVTTAFAVRVSNVYGSVTATATITVRLSYQEQVIFDGASDYWPLDDPSGTAARNMASPNPGTISGGVTLNQPGVTADSKAMTFDGTTGKIDAGNITALNFGAGSYTIEAWVYLNVGAAYYVPVGKGKNVGSTGWRAFISGANALVLFWATDGDAYPDSSLTLSVGAWHHVLWGYDAVAGGVFYAVDGVRQFLPSANHSVTGTDPLTIGCDSATYRFNGRLQDVAIYPRALSPTEIAAHYALRVP